MFFTVSEGIRELCVAMVANPHDWVQGGYCFTNKKHPDISIWTKNGVDSLHIMGNECFTFAEKMLIANSIKLTIARKLTAVTV